MKLYIIPFCGDDDDESGYRARVGYAGDSLWSVDCKHGTIFSTLQELTGPGTNFHHRVSGNAELEDYCIDGELVIVATFKVFGDLPDTWRVATEKLPPEFPELDHKVWKLVRAITENDVVLDLPGCLNRLKTHSVVTESAIIKICETLFPVGLDFDACDCYRVNYTDNMGSPQFPVKSVVVVNIDQSVQIDSESVYLAIAIGPNLDCWVVTQSIDEDDLLVATYPHLIDSYHYTDIPAIVKMLG